jgi:hypothetical protein
MSKRIVFAGGQQARNLSLCFRNAVLGGRGDTVAYIGPVAASRETGRAVLAEAEAIVLEVDDAGDMLSESVLPPKTERIRFPHVQADFLWPFAGTPHPKNRGFFPILGGPYPAEHGDAYLDRLAEEGLSEDDAVARYLALDIAKEAHLPSLLADRLARQRRLDDMTGFALAEVIEEQFRSTQLFFSRERPSRLLLQQTAATLFRKLGYDAALAEKLRKPPMPLDSMQPLHPGIIRHFGITYANADTRYPMNDEGRFTFEEYCHRYWRFEWNESLHRGIKLARAHPEEAIAELDRGLAWSPDSVAGQRALKMALAATGKGEAPPPEPDEEEQAPEPPQKPAPGGLPPMTNKTAGYVGLRGDEVAAAVPLSAAARAGGQDELIESLPEMLPSAHTMAESEPRAFSTMQELAPPPPPRPVLPPEIPGQQVKKSFWGKLFGR